MCLEMAGHCRQRISLAIPRGNAASILISLKSLRCYVWGSVCILIIIKPLILTLSTNYRCEKKGS